MELVFIKNILDIDVNSSRGINTYTIKAMYDEIDEEGCAELVFKLVDEVELTWNEISEQGGLDEVNKQLKEKYKIL